MLTPNERSMRGRLGALAVHAAGRTNTGPARAAFGARFYVDIPDDLPQAERDRRAGYARQAHFTRMSYLAARARSRKATSTR